MVVVADQEGVNVVWMGNNTRGGTFVPALRFYGYRQAEGMGFDLNKLRLQHIGPVVEPEKYAIVVELTCTNGFGTPEVVECTKYKFEDYKTRYHTYASSFLLAERNAISILAVANDFYLSGTLSKRLLRTDPIPSNELSIPICNTESELLWKLAWTFAESKGWQTMTLNGLNEPMFWKGDVSNHVIGREKFIRWFYDSCCNEPEDEGSVQDNSPRPVERQPTQTQEKENGPAETQLYNVKQLWEYCKSIHGAEYRKKKYVIRGIREPFKSKHDLKLYWEKHGLIRERNQSGLYSIVSASFPVAEEEDESSSPPSETLQQQDTYNFKAMWSICVNSHGAKYSGGKYRIPGLPVFEHENELISYWAKHGIIENAPDDRSFYSIVSPYFPYDRTRDDEPLAKSISGDSSRASSESGDAASVESLSIAERQRPTYKFTELFAKCRKEHGAKATINSAPLADGYLYILPGLDPFEKETGLLSYWIENQLIGDLGKGVYEILSDTFPYAKAPSTTTALREEPVAAATEAVAKPNPRVRRRSADSKQWSEVWKGLKKKGWTRSETGEYLRPKAEQDVGIRKPLFINRFPTSEDVMIYLKQSQDEIVEQMNNVSLSARRKSGPPSAQKNASKKRRKSLGDALKRSKPEPAAKNVSTTSGDPVIEARRELTTIWMELKKMGYKKEYPRGMDTFYYYLKPGVSLKTGTRDVDYFHGPVDFMKHVKSLKLEILDQSPPVATTATTSTSPQPAPKRAKKTTAAVKTPPPSDSRKPQIEAATPAYSEVSIESESTELSRNEKIQNLRQLLTRVGYRVEHPLKQLDTEYSWLEPGIGVKEARATGNYFRTTNDFYEHLERCDLTPFVSYLVRSNLPLEQGMKIMMPLLKIQGRSEREIRARMKSIDQSTTDLQEQFRTVLDLPVSAPAAYRASRQDSMETAGQEEVEEVAETQEIGVEETQTFEEELEETQVISRELTFPPSSQSPPPPTPSFESVLSNLGSTYLPPDFLGREQEMEAIQRFFQNALDPQQQLLPDPFDPHRQPKKTNGLYICGRPGTGKSAVMTRVQRMLPQMCSEQQKPMQVVTINAMQVLRLRQLFPLLVKEFLNRELTDPMECQSLLKAAKKTCVLILDEVDVLMNKAEHRNDIYCLLDWLSAPESNLVFVGIANTFDLTQDNEFGRMVQGSRFETLVLKPYHHSDLVKILYQRLNGSQLFDDIAVKVCASKVANNTGDVRDALSLCSRALQEASSKSSDIQVGLRDMIELCNTKYKPPVLKASTHMSRASKLVLYAVLRLENVPDPVLVKSSDLFIKYDECCRELTIMSGGHNTYVNSARELIQIGAIKAKGDVRNDDGWKRSLEIVPMRSEIESYLQNDPYFSRILK